MSKKDDTDNNRGRDLPMGLGYEPMVPTTIPTTGPEGEAYLRRKRLGAIMRKLKPYIFGAHENILLGEEYDNVTIGKKTKEEWEEVRALILEAIDLGQPRDTFPPSMRRRAGLN